jgi:hypothetical protein
MPPIDLSCSWDLFPRLTEESTKARLLGGYPANAQSFPESAVTGMDGVGDRALGAWGFQEDLLW